MTGRCRKDGPADAEALPRCRGSLPDVECAREERLTFRGGLRQRCIACGDRGGEANVVCCLVVDVC